MRRKSFATVLLLTASVYANADIGNTGTQQNCTQTGSDTASIAPTRNATWANQGLNRNIDRVVYGRDIVAYKIKWFAGQWSPWYVTGVNDLYLVTTPSATAGSVDARLAWIYFYDHEHQYISCS